MLSKELLLISGSMQTDFPPEIISPNEYDGTSAIAVTVNKCASKFETNRINITNINAVDREGNVVLQKNSAAFLFDYDINCYRQMFMLYHSDTTNEITLSLRLPSENEVMASFTVDNVYAQPPQWFVKTFKDKGTSLLITVKLEEGVTNPEVLGIVIDLRV